MHVTIDRDSPVPLAGFDFIGLIDRGTNLIEVKPTTRCNLRCAYCYASSGSYHNEFDVEASWLVNGLREMVACKGTTGIEAHIDPYGEALLCKDLERLISGLKEVEQVSKVSMQTNGTMFTGERVKSLKHAGLDQANVTLNALDDGLLARLSGRNDYNKEHLLQMLETLLETGIDVIITPVWFFGINDADINKIIGLYTDMKASHGDAVRLGIQNYLVYKTGRKLGKVKQRDFGYFYSRLKALEKEKGTKLLLGPSDFNIHPSPACKPPFDILAKENPGQIVEIKIVTSGRQPREWLGMLDGWGVKIVNFSRRELGNTISVPAGLLDIKGSLVTLVLRDGKSF